MKRFAFVILVTAWLLHPAWAAGDTPSTDEFSARIASQQTVDGENAVAVIFSRGLDSRQPLDTYLRIFRDTDIPVEGAWVLSEDPATAYFTNVEPDTGYRIEIYKGLKAADGAVVETAQVFELTTRPADPMISFGSKGFVLASELTRGLPVISLNIDKADIDFFRVRPDRTARFMETFFREQQMYYYQNRDLHKMADLVYSGRWDIEIKKNLRTNANIPITHIEALKLPGIYFAVLKGAGHYDYGYSATWFTISDLGIHARRYANAIQFQVQSLETARPLGGVSIQGYDKAGKRLFRAQTDADGVLRQAGAHGGLDMVLAAKDSHLSLLPMNTPALDLSEFRTATEAFRPVDLFVYGPRDIYRPGETVRMDGLLRNQDGGMIGNFPVRAAVYRPDGRRVHEFTWKGGELNYYTYAYPLPGDAITGVWEVKFSKAKTDLKSYKFLVSDFLPERMKFDITNPPGQTDILDRQQDLAMALKGDFLYGAPAGGSKADARIHIRPARELFRDQWPGYAFGDFKNLMTQSFTLDKITLDKEGKGLLRVKNEWKQVASPHWVTANASLYDSGGRPVVRNKSWQVWPAGTLVGIRSLAAGGEVDSDGVAQFEIMAADKAGNRVAAKGLKAVVIRELREYYWEFRNGSWEWGSTRQFYPVDRFTLDVPEDGTAMVDVPVKWGGYRLEIENPATGLVSAEKVWAGWLPYGGDGEDLNRPDRVDLVLDKAAYQPGDQARVTVKSPEGGTGYLFVEADTNLFTLPVTIPAEGKTFSIPIDPSWQRHDLYVSALIVRPGESKSGHLPKRAVGLTLLPLDRERRKLAVDIQLPKKLEPGRRIRVPVRIRSASGGIPEQAHVTLAAVDLGILNLTGFKTPSPHAYFFQPRRYGAQLNDLYQKLIEPSDGGWAKQRYGGDAPSLSRGGDRPVTDVQIIAFHRAAKKVDNDGMAMFDLDIPEFNGRVRLMAVAHTGDAFGSGDHELILASPVVTQMTMPRFLAMGDQSMLFLDVHNMTGVTQALDLSLDADLPVMIQGESRVKLTLAPNEKQAVPIQVTAGNQLKRSYIRCTLRGLVVDGKARELERSWFLETRPAYPAYSKGWQKKLLPGETLEPGTEAGAALIPETAVLRASLGSAPPIQVAEHVRQLSAYPYGCLEQTVSGLFPFVILGSEDLAEMGLAHETNTKTADKIRLGIQRLMEKQKSSGGFSLWNSQGAESAWLTAYAVHFLINAAQAGYEVPATSFKQAMERLVTYVRQPNAIPHASYYQPEPYKAAVRSYAAFVLAMGKSLTLGDARSVTKGAAKALKGSLGFVHAGLALYLAGDEPGAFKAFGRALETRRPAHLYIGDYGSDLRDFAAAYYLLATHCPGYRDKGRFIEELAPLLEDREWLSTQERNALVMAGAVRLHTPQDPWKAQLTVGQAGKDLAADRQTELDFFTTEAAGNFAVTNTGETDLFVNLVLSGYTRTSPEPVSNRVRVKRRYLDLNGKPAAANRLTSGDRFLVELAFKADLHMPNCLLVDLLPAGMELEDPNLSGSTVIDGIRVDKNTVAEYHNAYETLHTEYRDDRFVAALNLDAGHWFRRYYAVRVVTPGLYQVPPPLIEDMYLPHIRAVGGTPPKMEIANP